MLSHNVSNYNFDIPEANMNVEIQVPEYVRVTSDNTLIRMGQGGYKLLKGPEITKQAKYITADNKEVEYRWAPAKPQEENKSYKKAA